MAISFSNPFAVAQTGDWQVRIGTSWTDIDQLSAATMETAFKGSTKTIKIGPSSVLPHVADFDVGAMTWDRMPLRRATARTRGAPVAYEQLFSFWVDDGMWVDYCDYTQDLINSCRRNGRSKTKFCALHIFSDRGIAPWHLAQGVRPSTSESSKITE